MFRDTSGDCQANNSMYDVEDASPQLHNYTTCRWVTYHVFPPSFEYKERPKETPRHLKYL
jgi:hypothetical protein